MGLLDDYSGPGGILGIGMSPRPSSFHQIAISDILQQFDKRFREKGFRALPEEAISKNPEKAPDVVFFRGVNPYDPDWEPLVFVEITTSGELKKIISESKKLMNRLQIKEAFIYDYEKKSWDKIFDAESIHPKSESKSWCDTFEIDLNLFL